MAKINMKYVSLFLLVCFTSGQTLCMRYARTQPGPQYNSATAVLLGEVMKLVMSFMLICFEKHSISGGFSTISRTLQSNQIDVLKQAIPAILYTIQNNFLYVAISNLEAAVYQVSSQVKLLTAAIFSVTMLGKHIACAQWFSLFILGIGVALVQLDNTSSEPKENTNLFIGLGAILISCTTSGFAGVYMERMFKDVKLSIWVRNFWLAFWSLISGILMIAFTSPSTFNPSKFFEGYSIWAWIAIILLAIGGLIIALVLKYADNILKAFGGSASIILSSIISIYLFDFKVSTLFAIGCLLVSVATVLYSWGAPTTKKYQSLATSESQPLLSKKQETNNTTPL
ncbi:hypothetical protein WA158_001384 [Blastocystis sp. Blastoise]